MVQGNKEGLASKDERTVSVVRQNCITLPRWHRRPTYSNYMEYFGFRHHVRVIIGDGVISENHRHHGRFTGAKSVGDTGDR